VARKAKISIMPELTKGHSAMTEEERAETIAMLLAGYTVQEVVDKMGCNYMSVWQFRQRLTRQESNLARQTRSERFEDKIIDALTSTLDALRAQAKIASDPDYLRKQPIGAIAEAYGVMADRSTRILDAMSRVKERSLEQLPEPPQLIASPDEERAN